ncbi:hypothetical protein RSAG8_13976, partial [Rhizoctonia solani AG-8 WAC10335]
MTKRFYETETLEDGDPVRLEFQTIIRPHNPTRDIICVITFRLRDRLNMSGPSTGYPRKSATMPHFLQRKMRLGRMDSTPLFPLIRPVSGLPMTFRVDCSTGKHTNRRVQPISDVAYSLVRRGYFVIQGFMFTVRVGDDSHIWKEAIGGCRTGVRAQVLRVSSFASTTTSHMPGQFPRSLVLSCTYRGLSSLLSQLPRLLLRNPSAA